MTELTWWLTNAFNGEWLRIENVVPKAYSEGRRKFVRAVEEFEDVKREI
jgi:hypothetical protein